MVPTCREAVTGAATASGWMMCGQGVAAAAVPGPGSHFQFFSAGCTRGTGLGEWGRHAAPDSAGDRCQPGRVGLEPTGEGLALHRISPPTSIHRLGQRQGRPALPSRGWGGWGCWLCAEMGQGLPGSSKEEEAHCTGRLHPPSVGWHRTRLAGRPGSSQPQGGTEQVVIPRKKPGSGVEGAAQRRWKCAPRERSEAREGRGRLASKMMLRGPTTCHRRAGQAPPSPGGRAPGPQGPAGSAVGRHAALRLLRPGPASQGYFWATEGSDPIAQGPKRPSLWGLNPHRASVLLGAPARAPRPSCWPGPSGRWQPTGTTGQQALSSEPSVNIHGSLGTGAAPG